MMRHIKKFLRDLFTGRDNKTWDLGRIMWAQGFVVYCAISVYSLYQGLAIDPMNWASGLGLILAGGGAALKLKQSSEPKNEAAVETTVTAQTKTFISEDEVK